MGRKTNSKNIKRRVTTDMKIKFTALLFFVTFWTIAQEEFVIQNVRVFDGEKVKENAYVHVKNGYIEEISLTPITRVKSIDGKGKTLLPALTNSHVHVWSPVSLNEAAKAGVLNVLDMHAMESLMPMMKGFRKSTNHADYYAAGSAATAPKGHGTQYGFPVPTLTKPEEAKTFITGRVKAGVDYIKIIREPWKATLDFPTIAALVKEAHAANKKAVVHISKAEDAYQVLKAKANGLVHIWEDTTMDKKQLKALQKEHFFVIPTLLTMEKIQALFHKKTKEEVAQKIGVMQGEVKRLYDMKVPILAGTDPPNGQINYGTDLYKELELIQGAGIPILDVLRSATSLPAVHFNLEKKGFLKKGYRADMILVTGNPTKHLKDIWNTKTVYKLGKEVAQN